MRTAPGNRTVTKADLVDSAYELSTLSVKDVEELDNETLKKISDRLVLGETVKISRFGSFVSVHKAARVGRNPKHPTETHAIPALRRVTFHAANELKHHVRTGKRE